MHHVLLIDPSETRAALAERLRVQGWRVTATDDVAEGAHLALSDPPAAVVADLWMPGISGVQLCRLLGSEPATEQVPVVLRGPGHGGRDRFWAEHAGAKAYVQRGRTGDLVRAIAHAIEACPPQEQPFFTQLAGGELDLRDRIAAHLDAALFESVIAAEVRALGACESFDRLLDRLSQLCSQLCAYRWMAVYTARPERVGLHAHTTAPDHLADEALMALGLPDDVRVIRVHDEDPRPELEGPLPLVEPIVLGDEVLGRVAIATSAEPTDEDAEILRIVARELSGPVRIATLVEESQRLAMIDPLTGLLNRRAFVQAAVRELARMERSGESLSILLLDVDHFKAINDQHGHATGDLVLTTLGRLLPSWVRTSDLVGRWGGEEFVVALTGSPEAAALARAEAIRAAIASMAVHDGTGVLVRITASIGVALALPGEPVEALIDRADRAMYVAKSSGRNRVVSNVPAAEPAPAPSDPPEPGASDRRRRNHV